MRWWAPSWRSAVRYTTPGRATVWCVEPVLHCAVRGIQPPCTACRQGHDENCTNITAGDISAGVQTGYCRDTGGGWSGSLVAHDVQLHKVPDTVGNEQAVLVEPLSCALHVVLQTIDRRETPSDNVLVVGCGTIGLLTDRRPAHFGAPGRLFAVARYPHQRELALQLGADRVIEAGRTMCARCARSVVPASTRRKLAVQRCLAVSTWSSIASARLNRWIIRCVSRGHVVRRYWSACLRCQKQWTGRQSGTKS